MSDEEFAVKLRVEAHIDEVAEVSQKSGERIDKKNHSFAKDGFTYRRAYFKDFDGEYYEVTLSIGHNGTIATVYNVGKIKESVPPSAKIIAVAGSKPLGETHSKNSMPQNTKIVKIDYSFSDSYGRQLSTEQQAFFKDSRVRDENGNSDVFGKDIRLEAAPVRETVAENATVAPVGETVSNDPEFVGTEYGDTSYHTVVTVFEPDVERNGMPFDYAEELLSNPDNIELEIERRQPTGSATREKHPNTSSELPSFGDIVSQDGDIVKHSRSDFDGKQLTKEQQDFVKDSKVVDENGNLKVVYHGSPSDFNTFRLEYLGANGTAEGYGFYFTDKKSIAENYSRGREGQQNGEAGKLFEVYLDIKKPLSDTRVTMSRAQFRKFLTTLNKQVDADGERLDILSNYGDVEWEGLNKVLNYATQGQSDIAVKQRGQGIMPCPLFCF